MHLVTLTTDSKKQCFFTHNNDSFHCRCCKASVELCFLQNPNLWLPLKLLVKTEQGQGHRLVRQSMVGLVK